MKKIKYSSSEQEINNVLKYQNEELKNIKKFNTKDLNKQIEGSEKLLKSMGYSLNDVALGDNKSLKSKKNIIVPTWEQICEMSQKMKDADLIELFSNDELKKNEIAIKIMNEEFNTIHKLDSIDITITVVSALLASVIDILLVGIPEKTLNGVKAGSLSNYVRKMFEDKFPEVDMEELANSKVSKVPYDAQDNRHTTEYVDGLSAYYHRLLSLGHDPFLGLIFGVFDILTGRMTTIDKKGNFSSQIMKNYSNRKEKDIFEAIAKQIIHFKSDITTSMGLPAPLMGLFNFLQFGNIGETEQTIAEIVQGMYFEGYDFIQFCSASIPTMINEVVVRLCYSIKRIKEGHTIKESIPFSLNREKNPKLSTMLFISHSATSAINAGKVFFSKNPMSINYSEWITFAKYSYTQLKWAIAQKPKLKDEYVKGKLFENFNSIYEEIDKTFDKCLDDYNIIFN